MQHPADTDEYIAAFPPEVQEKLTAMRLAIKAAAPQAEEGISYGMPYYKLKGRLVYFAAHTKHVGLYPMASGIAKFKKELSGYKSAKGSVQFPFNQALPVELITAIIKFRVAENLEKAALKKKK